MIGVEHFCESSEAVADVSELEFSRLALTLAEVEAEAVESAAAADNRVAAGAGPAAAALVAGGTDTQGFAAMSRFVGVEVDMGIGIGREAGVEVEVGGRG